MKTTQKTPEHDRHLEAGRQGKRGFTLVELLISMTLLSLIMIILTSIIDSAHRAWKEGQSRTEAFQSARTCLEIMARELTPAVVDTRMQFVVAPGTLLSDYGAANVAPNSSTILWMSPLGSESDLRCVGYYLYRDEARKFYRLKRIFMGPEDIKGDAVKYFPKMVNLENPRDPELRTSPVNADWFTRNWDEDTFDEEDVSNDDAVVSTAADGVVAFWIQCVDVLGNPIPSLSQSKIHPPSDLTYNSAAYFQIATSTPFETGGSFYYLKKTPQSMKGNKVPSAVDLTVVTIDTSILEKGLVPPQQTNVYDINGALDVEASVRQYEDDLRLRKIHTARTFTTRAKLVNGN